MPADSIKKQFEEYCIKNRPSCNLDYCMDCIEKWYIEHTYPRDVMDEKIDKKIDKLIIENCNRTEIWTRETWNKKLEDFKQSLKKE